MDLFLCNLETEASNGLGSFVKADRVVEEIKIQYANKSTQVDIRRLKVGVGGERYSIGHDLESGRARAA